MWMLSSNPTRPEAIYKSVDFPLRYLNSRLWGIEYTRLVSYTCLVQHACANP